MQHGALIQDFKSRWLRCQHVLSGGRPCPCCLSWAIRHACRGLTTQLQRNHTWRRSRFSMPCQNVIYLSEWHLLVVLIINRASPQGTFPRWLHKETTPCHRASFPGSTHRDHAPKAPQQPNTREPHPSTSSPTSLGPVSVNDTGRAGLSARLGTTYTKPVQPYERTSYATSFPAAWPGLEPSHSSSLAPTSLSRTHTAPTLHIPSTYLCPHPPSSFPIPRACQHPITSTTSYITARVCHYTQDPSTVYTHLCVSILWDTSRPRSLDSSKPSPSSSAASRSSSISRPSPLASRI